MDVGAAKAEGVDADVAAGPRGGGVDDAQPPVEKAGDVSIGVLVVEVGWDDIVLHRYEHLQWIMAMLEAVQ